MPESSKDFEFIEKALSMVQKSCATELDLLDHGYVSSVIQKRVALHQSSGANAYLNILDSGSTEQEILLSNLYNGYSEFLRNPIVFCTLFQQLLPDMLKSKLSTKTLRIWSAGCSTGQEPYSLAMLCEELREFFPDLSYQIIATDINVNSLSFAQKGIFDDAQIQNLSLKWIRKYFDPLAVKGSSMPTYSIKESIRKRVEFSFFDLNDETHCGPPEGIFGDFDLVMCSNLLIYYNASARTKIIKKLLYNLSKEGIMICGDSEANLLRQNAALNVYRLSLPVFIKKKSTGIFKDCI